MVDIGASIARVKKDPRTGLTAQGTPRTPAPTVAKSTTPTLSGAANQADFLGEGTNATPQAPTNGTYAEELRRKRAEADRRAAEERSEALASQGRVNVGYVAGGPGGRTFSQTVRGPNDPMDIPTNHFADLARLGAYAGNALTNPIGFATQDHLPEQARFAINPVGYGMGAVTDEALDQRLPGGSGAYGDNIVPGQAGTGGDVNSPSETGDGMGGKNKGWGVVVQPNADAYAEQAYQAEARGDLAGMRDRYAQDRAAPTSSRAVLDTSAPQNVTASRNAAPVTVARAATYQAPTIRDVGDTRYARVGPVANVQRTTLGPAARAAAAGVDDTYIERGDDLQLRDAQLAQMQRLDDLAQGRGPSLVRSQLQSGVEESIAAQMAVESSARGLGNVAGSRRQAANSAAIARAAAAGQAAELGVKERLGAEQQLTGAAGAARQQDIGVATSQAGLLAQAEQQRSAQQQQAALANQAAENDRMLEQGRITAAEHSQNAASINAQRAQQASLQQQAYSQTSAQDAARATRNAELLAAQRSQLAGDTNQMAQTQAGINRDLSLANMEAANRLNEMFLDRDSRFKLAQLDVDSKKGLADLDARLRTMGMDDAMRMDIMAAELNQANILANQGIAYDQARVSNSIVREQLRRDKDPSFLESLAAEGLRTFGTIAGYSMGGPAGGAAGSGAGNLAGQLITK